MDDIFKCRCLKPFRSKFKSAPFRFLITPGSPSLFSPSLSPLRGCPKPCKCLDRCHCKNQCTACKSAENHAHQLLQMEQCRTKMEGLLGVGGGGASQSAPGGDAQTKPETRNSKAETRNPKPETLCRGRLVSWPLKTRTAAAPGARREVGAFHPHRQPQTSKHESTHQRTIDALGAGSRSGALNPRRQPRNTES